MGMYKEITNNVIDTQEQYLRVMVAYYVNYMRGFFNSLYGGSYYNFDAMPKSCEPEKPVKRKRK